MESYGDCSKCGTKWVRCVLYNDHLVGIDCLCLAEEIERDSGKHIRDEQALEEYRNLVAGTIGIPPTTYQES